MTKEIRNARAFFFPFLFLSFLFLARAPGEEDFRDNEGFAADNNDVESY